MNSEPPIKIFLIGDYLIFRIGLKMLIETKETFNVVCESANIAEAQDLVAKNKPDIVLINAPEIENEKFSEFMIKCCDNIPVLILSDTDSKNMFKICIELGARGLISKDVTPEILFRAIKQVYDGQLWFDRSLMGETMRQLMTQKQNGDDKTEVDGKSALTEREWEVLTQICKGMKNKAIAEKLFISETTVRHHLTSIFEKLNVDSRLQLVVYAFRNRLVEVPPQNRES